MSTNTYYHFFSYFRCGLSTSINSLPADGATRASIKVALKAKAKRLGSTEWDDSINSTIEQTVELYGPGDIEYFDDRIVTRTDPIRDSGNFEPNYFPAVEFADPDFPWRYSPEPVKQPEDGSLANDGVGITPWITLVVLAAEDQGDDIRKEFEDIRRENGYRPAIRVFDQRSLPNPHFAWRWAHVQASSEGETMNAEGLGKHIMSNPELVVSRLLCPRRLAPKTLYRAFVVPTYALGWATALATPAAQAAVTNAKAYSPAWDNSKSNPIDLPYYYDWEFRTSVRGDFEFLVRQLEGRKLEGLGLREMDCERPGYGLSVTVDEKDENKRHYLGLEGALQSTDTQYTAWGHDNKTNTAPNEFQKNLAKHVLNKASVSITPYTHIPNNWNDYLKELEISLHSYEDKLIISWETDQPCQLSIKIRNENLDCEKNIDFKQVKSSGRDTTGQLMPETTYLLSMVLNYSDKHIELTGGKVRIPLPAVTPPIYGRWHAASETLDLKDNSGQWLEQLNLDPRHRVAAGFGAEVIRKEQESFMASAWEQAGDIEAANEQLRRAKFGRDNSIFTHKRLGNMGLENFLRVSNPVHQRILRGIGKDKTTIASQISQQERIPNAIFSPAFRRILRPRGRIGRQLPTKNKMIERLGEGTLVVAGIAPILSGTPTISGHLYQFQSDYINDIIAEKMDSEIDFHIGNIDLDLTNKAVSLSLRWNTEGFNMVRAKGSWFGLKQAQGKQDFKFKFKDFEYSPLKKFKWPIVISKEDKVFKGRTNLKEFNLAFKLDCIKNNIGRITLGITLDFDIHGNTAWSRDILEFVPYNDKQIFETHPSFEWLNDLDSNDEDAGIAKLVIKKALEKLSPPIDSPPKPEKVSKDFLISLKADIHKEINPQKTILDRTRRKLGLHRRLGEKFTPDTEIDPLDDIMAYPEIPLPMYEELRNMSQSHILPGVEKIPQNTVALLQTNRRFIESYMVGLNHEFSSELLWRRFPTDQRGTYFKYFWDVSECVYIPDSESSDTKNWLKDNGFPDLDTLQKEDCIEIISTNASLAAEYAYNKDPNENIDIKEELVSGNFNYLLENDISLSLLKEMARHVISWHVYVEDSKDIKPIHDWEKKPLGHNSNIKANSSDEFLVLVVRGDLLKRYPNSVIYAVQPLPSDQTKPDLKEFIEDKDGKDEHKCEDPIYPIFRGSLGADLVFLGFPFSEAEARSNSSDNGQNQGGRFFVLEERITEARFGCDSPSALVHTSPPIKKDDLSWSHFRLKGGKNIEIGNYVDQAENVLKFENSIEWNPDTDSATRAQITLQRPARLIIHADQMLPS